MRLTLACLLAISALPAAAAELLPPLPLETAGMQRNPPSTEPNPPGSLSNCAASPSPGRVHYARLVIQNTLFNDVGPYAVQLPGYGRVTSVNAAPNFTYRPSLVTANPGEALRFDIVNQLTAADPVNPNGADNFHTHGLIVSPRPCSALGDFVLVQDAPGSTTYYRMDIPKTLPGTMFGSSPRERPYPSGLNWFHAHLHMASHDDVMGGQSGLLYIGDTLGDLKAAAGASSAVTLGNTDIKYLALRDIQVTVPAGKRPDAVPPKTPAAWVSGGAWNTGLCPSLANPAPPPSTPPAADFHGFGYCGAPGATAGSEVVWMFTVNGQYAPTLTMAPGRNQIWRLANLSASTVYALQLTDDATNEVIPLTVISLDGMVTGTTTPGSTSLKVGVTQPTVLMLPATRAEILVTNLAGTAGRQLTLRTTGITPGNPSSADPWPAISLAHVAMQPTTAAPGAARERLRASAPFDVTIPYGAFSRTAPQVSAQVATTPANCVTLPQDSVTRRRITFVENSSTDFELESQVVTADGTPVNDAANKIGPQQFPMQAALGTGVGGVQRVCPRLGSQEVWELVNTAQELHNFHIHQVKFRLSVQTDPGVPANLVNFFDPSGVFAPYLTEVNGAATGLDVHAYHDTMAVPPISSDGTTPGRVFVTIPFYARQQVGSLVFHCHFLDHEDNGMMEPVTVFDPSVKTAADDPAFDLAGLIEGSICKLR